MVKASNSVLRFSFLVLIIAMFCANSAVAQRTPNMVALSGNMAPALVHAIYVGRHDPRSTLNVVVVMKLRNTLQLNEFLQAVQDPTSSAYHQFLTPQQFTVMYGPTQGQVSAVVAYLAKQGLQVESISPNNLAIRFHDSTDEFERAFGVQINDYTYEGRRVYGPQGSPRFPSDIAGLVQSVIGLSDVAKMHPMLVRASAESPLSGAPSGYSPAQIATAYNWPSLDDTTNGGGMIIANATADSANFAVSDLDTFWSYYGLPTHTVTVTNVDGTPTTSDGTLETTIDEERAGAMAPGATLQVYDTTNTFGDFYDVYNEIVEANQAQIMTTSWGAPELTIGPTQAQADDQLFEEAAAQGITVFAAAGDHGSSDETSNSEEADYPSSDPYVVAAGGTTLTLNGNNTIASEVAWSNTGGAISSIFPEPPWQAGNGVPQNGWRNTADVSLDADPDTGYSVYEGGGWLVPYGGTSFVAPELAGLFADLGSQEGDKRLGAADTSIYADANISNFYSTDFHDINSGSNGAFSAGPGWDHPTGWGSLDASELLAHIEEAVSVPQDLSVEYEICRNGSDQYLVTWEPPATGVVTGYDAEWEEPNLGIGWEAMSGGTGGTRTISGVHPSTVVDIRVRATNGFVWSSYATLQFTSSVCRPPE